MDFLDLPLLFNILQLGSDLQTVVVYCSFYAYIHLVVQV